VKLTYRDLRRAHSERFKAGGWEALQPSTCYRRSKKLFSYRLSELVFGSLMATYVLGFVMFGASVGGAAGVTLDVMYDPLGWFHLKASKTIKFWTFIAYLFNFLLFSVLTAVIYFQYHQVLLFRAADLRNAYWDFLIALSLGAFFGMAMIAPAYTLSIFGVVLLVIFFKLHKVCVSYQKHLASVFAVSISDPIASDVYDKDLRKTMRAALSASPSPELRFFENRFWGWSGAAIGLFVATALLLVPLGVCFAPIFGLDGWVLVSVRAHWPEVSTVLTVCCFAALWFKLRRAENIKSDERERQDLLDEGLADVLDKLHATRVAMERRSETARSTNARSTNG
jgi:hypothetical protein